MTDQQADISTTEATLQRLRDDWKKELDAKMAVLRDEFEARLQAAGRDTNAGWFVRRIESLERENLALRLERDRAIAQSGRPSPHPSDLQSETLQQLRLKNESLMQDLRQAQAKLDGFRQLLTGDEPDGKLGKPGSPTESVKAEASNSSLGGQKPQTASVNVRPEDRSGSAVADRETTSQAVTPAALNGQGASQPSPALVAQTTTGQGKSRGPKSGRAFQRAEAIVLGIKDWNRLNPLESFAINPGILETVFHIHRQAAKDFFSAYQNELWEYHQEINVESPRWHNRGKDMEKLKAFVEERLNG